VTGVCGQVQFLEWYPRPNHLAPKVAARGTPDVSVGTRAWRRLWKVCKGVRTGRIAALRVVAALTPVPSRLSKSS